MKTLDDGASIFTIPIGYAIFGFGLMAFALGTVLPVGIAVPAAGVWALLIAFLKWDRIANGIMARWSASNRLVIAQHNSTATSLDFMAGAFAAPTAESAEAGQPEPEQDAITVNTAQGSYSVPRYSEAEVKLQAKIGECLRFLRIGEKAGKFSLRAMMPYRPTGMSEKDFEAWWTAQGDQLVAWVQFEKVAKSGTRPLKPVKDIRTALLSRSFKEAAETVA